MPAILAGGQSVPGERLMRDADKKSKKHFHKEKKGEQLEHPNPEKAPRIYVPGAAGSTWFATPKIASEDQLDPE